MNRTAGEGPVVCFGELLLRLSPEPGMQLSRADSLALAVGGAEANVAVALASLGVSVRMLSVVPYNPLGLRALAALGEAGVDRTFVHDGSGRMGVYFFEPPSGPISGRVTYDRGGSAFVQATPEEMRFAEALSGASDIIAEMLSDNAEIRSVLRAFIRRTASLHTEEAKDEKYPIEKDQKY